MSFHFQVVGKFCVGTQLRNLFNYYGPRPKSSEESQPLLAILKMQRELQSAGASVPRLYLKLSSFVTMAQNDPVTPKSSGVSIEAFKQILK